ncbi:unnamed protein product [Lupinus luteus]|uniref:C2 domain-containing protein n=1 Tax=Lupinus luteus TaxID=3873 RepID=A0AAV1YFW0_LUPLU
MSAGQPSESDKLTRKYDLIEQMQFLFIRVVRGRAIIMPNNNSNNMFVEIIIGNTKGTTRFFDDDENKACLEWDHVFAFEKDKIQDLGVEVLVMYSVDVAPAIFGRVRFTLSDIPWRVPPEPLLAPRWYKLEDENGAQLAKGEIMLSMWIGTQADEYFPQAWSSDASNTSDDAMAYARSKVYITPTLWYLRVNVIQAQNLLLRINADDNKGSDIFVQVVLGSITLRTNFSKNKSANPSWNQDLMFVAQEPFNDTLVLSVEQGTFSEHVSLGSYEIPLKIVDKRLDSSGVADKWYNLNRPEINENQKEVNFASKVNARISLDGAYHVMEEPIEYSSDFRPSAKKLWRQNIGVLELGILKGTGLEPMKNGARTDAYCVAKCGSKWVHTRTAVNSFSPKWNEQYVWEVYEPSTVITIAVFDNNQLDANSRVMGAKDAIMGKIRIRLSTLGHGKVHAHSYPLITLQPSGFKKMGEIHLAVRFSWTLFSTLDICKLYIEPLLPKHHYLFPLSPSQSDTLRNQAATLISQRLGTAEPPLRKEVVHYILDMKSNMWSMRKARANVQRVMNLIGNIIFLWKLLQDISYFKRPKIPCYIDAKLSGAETSSAEDFEEELDPCPTKLEGKALRMRYDRLRYIGRSTQKMVDELATIGEKVQSLSSWRDEIATFLFALFCSVGLLVTIIVPTQVLIFLCITYYIWYPRFRSILPCVAENLFRRMPSKQAFIL